MIARIAIGLVALLLLGLGIMNAANKAGLLGPGKPPTTIAGRSVSLTLPPLWHADTGNLEGLSDDVCRLLQPAQQCQAYFVKGLGSPRALLAVAIGPASGGASAAGLQTALSREGVTASAAMPIPGVAGGARYRSAYKKRGRQASLAVTDAIPAGSELLLLQVVAEEPEGRYQEQLLAEIEKSLAGATTEVQPK